MANSQVINASTFQNALDEFRSSLSQEDQDEISYTTLEDLQRCILEIQHKHASARKARNMERLKMFLEAMEQYAKVIEVFLNASDVLCFVWGPMKFLLQVSSTFTEAFDELLDMYKYIGESLPLFGQYTALFQDKNFSHMLKVLEMIYLDILKFHHMACKYFKQRVWKQLFRAAWKTYRTRFRPIIEDLQRHKRLVETQANLVEFEEIQNLRATANAEFQRLKEVEELRQRSAVRDWLAAAVVDEDQEAKASARSEYPGVCRWILGQGKFDAWKDINSQANHLLWITGIPGAGKSTLTSFVIETLQSLPSAHVLFFYCKNNDKDRDSFVALARGLIGQVVLQEDAILPYMFEESSTSGERPLKTIKRSQNILETSLKSLNNTYVVIDGLDECRPGEKSTIVSWFNNIATLLHDDGVHFRCLFSSQSDEETSKLFKGIPSLQVGGNGLHRDISIFCDIEVRKIKGKFSLSDSETDSIAKKVSSEAKDMFLYAKLVMHNLRSQTKLANLRRELEPGRFPKDLNQAYGRIVDRILDPQSLHRDDVLQLLGFLVCAKRPVKWYEIQGAVSVDIESRTCDFHGRSFRVEAKDLCGSLVEVRPGGVVELVHTTAKAYLLLESRIRLHKEELVLTRLCLEYLRMSCFESSLDEQQIHDLIMTGHYAFAEYAIVHWPEHLIAAIGGQGLEKSDVNSLAESVSLFLTAHFILQSSVEWTPQSIKDEIKKFESFTFSEQLAQTIAIHRIRRRSDKELLKGIENPEDLNDNLDLEKVLRRVRSVMCRMYMGHSDSTRQTLEEIYGTKLFKCSRIDCNMFSEGFSCPLAQSEHEGKHRKLSCPYGDCAATFTGSSSKKRLWQHINHVHDRHQNSVFPTHGVDESTAAMKEAIEDLDFEAVEELARICMPYSPGSRPFFVLNDHCSKTVWREALRNPNEKMINIIEGLTTFEGTNAQSYILEQAARVGEKELVRRFVADEYRNGKLRRTRILWDRAFDVAIDRGDAEILEILINGALRNPKDGTQRRENKRLREFCIKACIEGRLSCVQCFVSNHGVDPFSHSKVKRTEAADKIGSVQAQQKVWNRYSVLYHAIQSGNMELIRYLQTFEGDPRFSKPEPVESLLTVAAANGYENVLPMLTKGKDLDPGVAENFLLKALLYNLIRRGKEERAQRMLQVCTPLDVPDRNDCTPIMYAAYNGLKEVVEHLIQQDANVNQIGWFEIGRHRGLWRAKDLAERNGHLRIHGLLTDASKASQSSLTPEKVMQDYRAMRARWVLEKKRRREISP